LGVRASNFPERAFGTVPFETGSGFWVLGLGSGVWGLGFWVLGLGCGVWGLVIGFRATDLPRAF
jgi:hypothetical protein